VTSPEPRFFPCVPSSFRSCSCSQVRAVPALIAVMVLCFAPVAPAARHASQGAREKPYALIFGTVWGPDDQPLYGVKVKIRRADQKKSHWELYSDHRGEFAQRMPAGRQDYLVSADLKGYKYGKGRPLRLPQEVRVHIEYDERADIGLHLTQ
jgi:hypothetical protein